MCLKTSAKKPRIAKTDIKVFKILKKTKDKGYITPIRKSPVNFDGITVASENSEAVTFPIQGGWIHALTSYQNAVDYRGRLFNNQQHIFNAVIPAGTEYFISNDLTEIASRKMYITNQQSKKEAKAIVYDDILKDYIDNTTFGDEVMVGDVVYGDLSTKHINEIESYNNIIGIVGAITNDTIVITALEQAYLQWRKKSRSGWYEEWIFEMERHQSSLNCTAFEFCSNYNKGEHKWQLDNADNLYSIVTENAGIINTTVTLLRKKHIDAEYIEDNIKYWSSTEINDYYAICCNSSVRSTMEYNKSHVCCVRPSLIIYKTEKSVI